MQWRSWRVRGVAVAFFLVLLSPSPARAQSSEDSPPQAQTAPQSGDCGRRSDRDDSVHVDGRARALCRRHVGGRRARQVDRHAPCLLGKTWGYDDTGIWVSDGCAGEFIAGQARRQQTEKQKPLEHVPNAGFLLYDGEKGQIYFRLFSYVRYLNQRNIDASYTDAFGVQHTVQQRQDVQLAKFFAPFSGWFLTPKFRYYLYVWSSNASQGDPAQVVGAGNLSYMFNRFRHRGRRHHLAADRAQHGRAVSLLARRRRPADRRRVLPRLLHQRRLGEGRSLPEAEIQRDVRHQPEHPRRERVADRQQDGHAVVRADVAADDRRVRPVRDVRRLRLPREGGDARRRATGRTASRTSRASRARTGSRTARSASPTAASSSRPICSARASR